MAEQTNDKKSERKLVRLRNNKHELTSRGTSLCHLTDSTKNPSSEDLLDPGTSLKSSLDSLIEDPDWADTSFYALPSFQKKDNWSSIGSSVVSTFIQAKDKPVDHAFPEYEVHQISSLDGQGRHSTINKQFYRRPCYHHPHKVMNVRDHQQVVQRYSADSIVDDTIGRSSGIASDIDSPRSIRSTLLETTSRLTDALTTTNTLRLSSKVPHLVQSNVNSWNQGFDSIHSTDSCVAIHTGVLSSKQYDKVLSKTFKEENMTTGQHNNPLVLNNGVRSGHSLMKEKNFCRNNTKNWKHVSLVNSFSLDTSPVWALKLLESTPTLYQQLLLKASLFRRWHLRSCLRRLKRIENDNKTNKAVEFWNNTNLQKYFKAWQKLKVDQQIKADNLYHKHIIEMGIKGLQFAVQVSTKVRSDVKRRLDSRHMAKYWLKWQNHMTKRKREKLRSAFNRWRVLHLEGNRDKILEGIANKHIMSRNYIKWKMRYLVEQNNSVAALNFQITLLTKCWHSWRVYAAHRVVKTRTDEVARIHYQNNLQAHVFQVWLMGRKKFSVANGLAKRRTVIKAFYSWKNWTQYAKVIHQRFQSMCKEYYSRALLRQSFVKWKQRMMLVKADNYSGKLLQKRVYHLWFLRHRRKVIHRHLCKAMSRKGKKRRFFHKWLNVTQSQHERRKAFVNILYTMLLSRVMLTWKDHSNRKISIRQRYDWLRQNNDALTTRKAMDKWLFSMKVANFKKQAKISWTKRCVRKACVEWKLLLKRKYLEHTLIESRPTRNLWLLRAFWNAWRKKKEHVDREQEHVNSVKTILTRNFKQRVFQAWRVTNQQEQIIAPTAARRERKYLARVFDAWRLYIYRLTYVVDQHTRNEEKVLDKHFLYWRERTFLRVKECDATARLQFSKLTRAFLAWHGHIHKIRYERLKHRAQTLQLLSAYFNKWSQRLEASLEIKEKQISQQARKQLLLIWVFKYWRQSAVCQRHHFFQMEEKVVFKSRHLQMKRSMNIWHRSYIIAVIVRNYQASCQERLLQKVFNAWSTLIKDEMNEQLNRFSSNLALDCSMGSTLDASVSDYLSSGYWTTRRGSGSVFRSPVVSQRDDDVASLPGRIDEIHPDSPRFRSASPITLIRESSPLVLHTPTSSPSPSPPDLHLSLPTSTASSESVFSLVKERGDSLQLRSELERTHSIEDEEFDCMSMTSGMSSASVRDKEMVIIDTILHWRSLPLSLTFRTWLKYTRQKKLLRELLYFAREKKAQDIMSSNLEQWRRELYITVAARQYGYNCTRLRCLRAWHVYVEMCRKEERCMQSANVFNISWLLKRFFNSWRNKHFAKKKLQSIVSQWQKKAVVTDKHKAIGEKIHIQCNQRGLSQRFQYWMLMTHKSQEAQLFYLERLLPRSFFAWHQYSCTRATNRKKALWFREQSVLIFAFRQWHERFESQCRVQDFAEAKEIKFTVGIIKSWHEWATGVCTRRRLWRSYHRSLQIDTLKEIFTVWLCQVKRREAAKKLYEYSLLRRVILSWQEVNHIVQENKIKASTLKHSCANRQLRQRFIFWHQLLIHHQLALCNALQRDKALVKNYLKKWRNFILKSRAEKYFINCMLKKVYLQWYEGCLGRKKARHLLRSWRSITNASKALNSKATEISQLTDKKTLHQYFMFWIQETHKIQKAKHHYGTITSRSSLCAWYSYAHTKAHCRKTLTQVEIAKTKTLLTDSFCTWRESFLHKLATQEILDQYLQRKQVEYLQSCMLKWTKYIKNHRAHRHHHFRLVLKSFSGWRYRLYQKKGLEKIIKKVFYRRIRQAAIHWQQWTMKTKQQQCQADEFQVTVDNRAVQLSFSYWVMATEKSCRAKDQYNMTVLKRALFLWKKVVDSKRKERQIIDKFQMQAMNKKIAEFLLKWKCELEQSKRNKQLVCNQKLKQNKLVLCGCMQQWKKYTKKSRADMHYTVVLVAQSFLDWKLRFEERLVQKNKKQVQEEKALKYYHNRLSRICLRSWYNDLCVQKYQEMKQQLLIKKHFQSWKKKGTLKSIASDLGDRQTYSQYWAKWRNQLVRKRVAELMMKHEEKKLLSEVFGSWYKLTMIQRRLLKEWNVFLTEKWFRRWMQKYNES